MVNEKMTAIADKIRILLGITGKMGLDVMATNLATAMANIDSAFTAIGNKGGTVPSSKVTGNLVSAIESIPVGAKIQIKTGSFTVSNSSASVNVGFKPDLVVIKVGTNQYNSTQNDPAFGFTASGKTKLSITSVAKSSSYMYMNTNCTQTANGFDVGMTNINSSHQTSGVNGVSFEYVAVKYT